MKTVSMLMQLNYAKDVTQLRHFGNACRMAGVQISSKLIGDGSFAVVNCKDEENNEKFSEIVAKYNTKKVDPFKPTKGDK